MEVQEFMLLLLIAENDSTYINKVKDFNPHKNGLYEENWFTSLFWELVDSLKYCAHHYPFEYITDVQTYSDIEHQVEERLLIVKRDSDDVFFGLKYETTNEGNKLFNNVKFEIVIPKVKTVTEYKFKHLKE